jgi:hypothetical protein
MRILFLAANPLTTSRLDLEEELRAVEKELRGCLYREEVLLSFHYAVQPDDLVQHVREEKPTVIHFSGHGSHGGVVLRDDRGAHQPVTGARLQRFLEGRGVALVVLNACYSKSQATAMRRAVKAVVGTTDAVEDEAARRFSVAFYRSVGNGLSLEEAFRDGRDAAILYGHRDVFWHGGDLRQVLLPGRLRHNPPIDGTDEPQRKIRVGFVPGYTPAFGKLRKALEADELVDQSVLEDDPHRLQGYLEGEFRDPATRFVFFVDLTSHVHSPVSYSALDFIRIARERGRRLSHKPIFVLYSHATTLEDALRSDFLASSDGGALGRYYRLDASLEVGLLTEECRAVLRRIIVEWRRNPDSGPTPL